MKKLRAYLVTDKNEPIGIAVIARTAKEAKAIGYEELDCEYTDLRVGWVRDAKVNGLEQGVLKDNMDGLARGIYSYIENAACDICGAVGPVQELRGMAMCGKCYDDDGGI